LEATEAQAFTRKAQNESFKKSRKEALFNR
jgi:hypothetical protein